MDPTTTTEPVTQEPGAPVAQPEEQPGTAVTTPDPEPTPATEQPSQDEEPAPAENSEDFDYEAWLNKKGIDPTTPEGKAAIAKSWREMEKKMHSTTTQASELSKQLEQPTQVDTDNPLVQNLASKVIEMERAQKVNQFVQDVKLTEAQEKTMAEYLQANPDKGQLVNLGYMSLHDVYQLSGAAQNDPASLKHEGGKAALEKLASKQLTTAPTGNATTPTTPKVDPIAAALSD